MDRRSGENIPGGGQVIVKTIPAPSERVSMSMVLVVLGLLDFRRRRIPLPFFRLPDVKIS